MLPSDIHLPLPNSVKLSFRLSYSILGFYRSRIQSQSLLCCSKGLSASLDALNYSVSIMQRSTISRVAVDIVDLLLRESRLL